MQCERSKKFVLAGLPLVLGMISGWIATKGPYIERQRSARVSFQPPGWVFSVAWTVLYVLMGWSLFRLLSLSKSIQKRARWVFILFWLQLGANVIWSPVHTFVKEENVSLYLIYLIFALSLATTVGAFQYDTTAGALLVPYLAWLVFASVLSRASIDAHKESE